MSQEKEIIARLRKKAVAAFGESEGRQFIHRPLRAFDGRSARQMVEIEKDAKQVFDYLGYLTAAEDQWKRHGVRGYEH